MGDKPPWRLFIAEAGIQNISPEKRLVRILAELHQIDWEVIPANRLPIIIYGEFPFQKI